MGLVTQRYLAILLIVGPSPCPLLTQGQCPAIHGPMPFYPQDRPGGSKETELMGEGMSERMREAGQKGSEGEGDREGEEKEAGRLLSP